MDIQVNNLEQTEKSEANKAAETSEDYIILSRKKSESCSISALSYLGDAVFELLARKKFVMAHDSKSGELHKKTVQVVNSKAQAKMAENILRYLTDDEQAIYKRGRNAAVNSMPKNAELSDYCKATGIEAVFGFLYMEDKRDRLLELFGICMKILEKY